ncbi:hypothetical protein [Catellatospora vulcania]|uniref:hypothetical protein n=1 Tax=Catellatospora vulcania TaxID=1460450 RepID=UPI0012D42245|nr:hypothetical protein [Catellatospora vulcania]
MEEKLLDNCDLDGLCEAISVAARSLGLSGEGLSRLCTAFGEVAASAIHQAAGIRQVLLWQDKDAVYCQVTGCGAADQSGWRSVAGGWRTAPALVDVFELSATTPAVATIGVLHTRHAVPALGERGDPWGEPTPEALAKAGADVQTRNRIADAAIDSIALPVS